MENPSTESEEIQAVKVVIDQRHVEELAKHLLLVSLTLATVSVIVVVTLSPLVRNRSILKDELPKLQEFSKNLGSVHSNPTDEWIKRTFAFTAQGKAHCVEASVPAHLPASAASLRQAARVRGPRLT